MKALIYLLDKEQYQIRRRSIISKQKMKIYFQKPFAVLVRIIINIYNMKYVKVTRSVIYTVLGQEPCVDSLANPQ